MTTEEFEKWADGYFGPFDGNDFSIERHCSFIAWQARQPEVDTLRARIAELEFGAKSILQMLLTENNKANALFRAEDELRVLLASPAPMEPDAALIDDGETGVQLPPIDSAQLQEAHGWPEPLPGDELFAPRCNACAGHGVIYGGSELEVKQCRKCEGRGVIEAKPAAAQEVSRG